MIPRKFLFTGTISVGKSTTLEYLRGLNLPGIGFVTEAARDIINSAPSSYIRENELGILRPNLGSTIFDQQKRREADCAKLGPRIVLCDRGSLDLITHARVLGRKVKSEWEDWVNTFDQIFYFSKEGVPFNADSYPRGVDWKAFRNELDRETRLFLASCSIPQQELSGTVQQRAETIRSYFDGQYMNREGNSAHSKERF